MKVCLLGNRNHKNELNMKIKVKNYAKKGDHCGWVGKIGCIFVLCVVLCPLAVWAQLGVVTPAGTEFQGVWTFDHAQAKEKPADTQQEYVKQEITLDDFIKKPYLFTTPTEIMFLEDGLLAHISHPYFSFMVGAVIFEGKLEFRAFGENPEEPEEKPDLSKIDSYRLVKPAYEWTLKENMLSLKFNYRDNNVKGKTVEGMITIYYKR